MRILVEFDTENVELHAIEFARIMLDIQHLAIVVRALAEDRLHPNDIVFDPYKQKYQWMIEAAGPDIGMAELTIVNITEGSLLIELEPKKVARKIQKAFTRAFRYVINHFLFVDLERQKRSVEIQMMREQLLRKRIGNAAAALGLIKKIPDAQLREEFIDSLRSSVLPFLFEHPPIKSVKLIGDTDERANDNTDEDLMDDLDDDSKPN
jgi:hypothetical protein